MINTTLLSLRIYGSNALSPFISRNLKRQFSFFKIEKSHFQRFANSFLYSNHRENIRISESSYKYFLNSAISVQNYAPECLEYSNVTNDQIDVLRACVFVRDSWWEGQTDYSIISAGAVMCERVNFSYCNARTNGGAINMVSTNDCELVDCICDHCTAANAGGALYLEGKNMKAHMLQIISCTSTNTSSCVYMWARSLIARHFYTDAASDVFRFIQEDVLYYPGYYIVMAHSFLRTPMIADVDNITLSDTEFNTQEFAIVSSTVINISLYRVSFTGSNNCIDFTGATPIIYDTNEIYVGSPNGAIFYPKVPVLSMVNRPPVPIATPQRTYDPNNPPYGGDGTGDNGGANNGQSGTTSGGSGGLSVGWIIFIVIMCIIVVLAIIGAIYFCLTRTEITIQTDEKRTQYNFG